MQLSGAQEILEARSYAGHKILLSLSQKLLSHSINFLKTTLKS